MLATQALPRASSSYAVPLLRSIPRHVRLQPQFRPQPKHLLHFSSTSRIMSLNSYIVTPAELHEALKTSPPTETLSPSASSSTSSTPTSKPSRIIPLCASWFLPNDPEKRTGQLVFSQSRIPHARFFDLDAVKDADSPYPHMLPTAEVFAAAMSGLGLERSDRLVVYDSAELGLFSAPRVAWTLRVFGHERVHVLNNFRLWKEGGFPLETGPVKDEAYNKTKYAVPTFCSDRIIAFREVKDIARRRKSGDDEKVQVIDVRSRARFEGTGVEPRPGLSSGHMPGAFNIPLPELLDAKSGAMLPKDKLREVFEKSGLDPEKPIVSTCGTGVMAAACDMALELADFGRLDERRVYDGSWTEYASRVDKDDGLIMKKD